MILQVEPEIDYTVMRKRILYIKRFFSKLYSITPTALRSPHFTAKLYMFLNKCEWAPIACIHYIKDIIT